MNRKEFLQTIAVGGLAAAAMPSTLAAAAEPAAQEPLHFTSAPLLTNPADDAVTLLIGVSGASSIAVHYGETPELGHVNYGAHEGLRSYDARVHKVRLTNLAPGTQYHYRVEAQGVTFHNAYKIERGATISTEPRSFRTLNSAGDSCRFAIWNDTHDKADVLAALHAATDKLAPDFMLWNGDISNDISTEEQFTTLFLAPGERLPFAEKTPLMLVRGNHDLRGAAARLLPRYSDTPGNRSYYSFRHGPMAFIVLDTGEDKPDSHPVYAGLNDFRAFRAAQRAWLAEEIERPHIRDAKWRVVCCHIPLAWLRPRETGTWCQDGAEQWHDLLVKAGVHLVISGHTHEWAHLPPQDARPYHQLIGGGPRMNGATLVRGEVTEGQLRVTLAALASGKELASLALS